MRWIKCILLSFCVLTLTSGNAWIYLQFKIDQDRIVRELCIQKELPVSENTCLGHCELQKRLEQGQEKENPLQESHPKQLTEIFYTPHSENFTFITFAPIPREDWTSTLVEFVPQKDLGEIFHPPRS